MTEQDEKTANRMKLIKQFVRLLVYMVLPGLLFVRLGRNYVGWIFIITATLSVSGVRVMSQLEPDPLYYDAVRTLIYVTLANVVLSAVYVLLNFRTATTSRVDSVFIVLAIVFACALSPLGGSKWGSHTLRYNGMCPTYCIGETVIIDYKPGLLIKGRSIAYRQNERIFVRRVAATPGDYVCWLLNERVALAANPDFPDNICRSITRISDGEYFVLGDNPTSISDSRKQWHGLVTKNQIIGEIAFSRNWFNAKQ